MFPGIISAFVANSHLSYLGPRRTCAVGAIDWNTLRILRSLRKSSTQLEPNGYGTVSDRCLRTSNSAGYGDVECRRWFQAFQPRWSKRVRSEAMENVVSVEDDCYDICWMEMR